MAPEAPQPVWLPQETAAGSVPVTVKCHCGRCAVELPSAPQKINECRCSICYKYGALWAYYLRDEVMVTTSAEPPPGVSQQAYIRKDDAADGDVSFHRCGVCGCLTHWWGFGDSPKRTGPKAKMGVNCRLLPESAIEGVERHVTYVD